MITPIAPYVFTFPRDEAGKDVKFRFMLTISKPLTKKISGEESVGSRLLKGLAQLDGVDAVQGVGRYTVEVVLARTFDPDVLIEEIKKIVVEEALSEIIRPTLVTA